MEKSIEFRDNQEQLALFGPHDRYLRRVRDCFGIRCVARSGRLKLDGAEDAVLDAYVVVLKLLEHVRRMGELDDPTVENALLNVGPIPNREMVDVPHRDTSDSGRFPSVRKAGGGSRESGAHRSTRGGRAGGRNGDDGLPPALEAERRSGRPRTLRPEEVLEGRLEVASALTPGQTRYVQAMKTHDVVFSIGPAGTGKTFLATAMAVDCLNRGVVRKIVLVRPAVEAGEKLGFLPGDYQAKINPYLRPIFDALGSLLDYSALRRYMERDIIEIAPLAYMRGRTLEHAFIILDEAQNTTPRQMMMFLTRFGRFSKVVVTGDVTQIDLEFDQHSGLVDAERVLASIPGIRFINLTEEDIVRHALVQKIVTAYEGAEKRARIPLFRDKRNATSTPPRRPTRFDPNPANDADAGSSAPTPAAKVDPHTNTNDAPTSGESTATSEP